MQKVIIFLMVSIHVTFSSLMSSVYIAEDFTFTESDRFALRKAYRDTENDKISFRGPKINRQDFYGKTALYSACEFGRTSVVLFLLKEFNADINIPADNGLTPLLVACSNGHIDVVKLLLCWKVDFIEDAMHIAKKGRYSKILSLLANEHELKDCGEGSPKSVWDVIS